MRANSECIKPTGTEGVSFLSNKSACTCQCLFLNDIYANLNSFVGFRLILELSLVYLWIYKWMKEDRICFRYFEHLDVD